MERVKNEKEVVNGFEFEIFTQRGCIVPVTTALYHLLTDDYYSNETHERHYGSYTINEVIEEVTNNNDSYNIDNDEIEELKAISKLFDEDKIDFVEFEKAL